MPEQGTSWLHHIVKIVLLVLAAIAVFAVAGYLGYHLFSSAKADDLDRLADFAGEYLDVENLQVERTEQRGDYLAALCGNDKGRWCLCEYERDRVWHNRWRACGGIERLRTGELASWNYGSPQGEAVLIFCGYRLNGQAYWYTFRSDGVTYVCPVRDEPLLDIFVIPGCRDISAVPVLLGKDYQRLEG